MTDDLDDGIYFGLDEETYQALPRLSASGIKVLVKSPLKFWFTSHLNPQRKEEKDTPAKKLGRAYHKLILEGDAAFGRAYAVAPSKDEYPDALDGEKVLRAKCAELGVKAKSSDRVADLCEIIREVDPAIQLWADIKAEFEARAAGREVLTQAQWEEIEQVRFVLHHMPEIQTAFTGGFPEVTILFTFHGISMKARLDYLKPRGQRAGILDLKSFGNIMDKAIEEIPADEIGRNNYFVQPYVYNLARRIAGNLWKRLGRDVVHVSKEMAGPTDEWLDAALLPDKAQFHFVFVQTGGVPDIIVREFAEGQSFSGLSWQANEYWRKGKALFENGIGRFAECMKTYGSDAPWIVDHGIKALDDQDFKPWTLEYRNELSSDAIDDWKDAA